MALVVAALMLLGMTSAFAAGSINLVDDTEGANIHEYKVYQIYTGTLEEGKLVKVKYGHNYGNEGSAVPKTELDAIGSSEADAIAFAKVAEANLTNRDNPVAVLSSTDFSATGLADGYYLIVDDTAKTLTDGDAYSAYILQVLGSEVDFAVKKDTVTSDKKIIADDLGEDGTNEFDLGTTIDNVSVGDTVTFVLTGTVPSHATDYDYYYFIMNDTLDEGFDFDEATAEISVTSNKDGKATLVKDTDYKVYTDTDCDDGHTFEIALLDAKSFAGKTITVTYKATLNENCEMHEDPNHNTFTVTYSNNPNEEYDGTNEDGKPGKPNETTKSVLGETPEKTTETFTTGFRVKKVDQDGMPLKGVTFQISGTSLQTIVTYTETFEAGSGDGFDYWKLTNDSYTTIAPQTVDTMVADSSLTQGRGYVRDDVNGTITVGGVKYRVVTAEETGTHTLVKANSTLYASTTQKYKKNIVKTTEEAGSDVDVELTVGDDGILDFQGLGAGTYTVSETDAPDGYTKARDFDVIISFDEDGEDKWSFEGTTGVDDDGVYYVQVVNRAGNTLPETGGMGTTLLYIGGSVLVILAAVLLITKRRMSVND